MKVRIAYTVDADDELRRAINLWHGVPGLATRAEVARWFERYGHSMADDLSLLLSAWQREGRDPR